MKGGLGKEAMYKGEKRIDGWNSIHVCNFNTFMA